MNSKKELLYIALYAILSLTSISCKSLNRGEVIDPSLFPPGLVLDEHIRVTK